jgi:protein-tyrosine phosphatase
MSQTKILIHCTGGIDRAPFVVASYLVKVYGLDLADAYRQIKKVRPGVCEHPEWK